MTATTTFLSFVIVTIPVVPATSVERSAIGAVVPAVMLWCRRLPPVGMVLAGTGLVGRR